MNAFSLGIIFSALGILCWLVVWVVVRIISQAGYGNDLTFANYILAIDSFQLGKHEDAVVLIQPGGKVIFANENSRQMFHLGQDEVPNLENLASHFRLGEKFFSLCAAEGQERLILDGRLTEVTSYSLRTQGVPSTLQMVTLRYFELLTGAHQNSTPTSPASFVNLSGDLTTRTLQTTIDLAQTIASSLNLEATLQSILDCLDKLVPTDLVEISLWDSEQRNLTLFRTFGLPGKGRKLQQAKESYLLGEGLCGTVALQRSLLLVDKFENHPLLKTGINNREFPIQSYLGIPLLLEDSLIGTIGLGSLVVDSLRKEEANLLDLFSGQMAIAIRNALLYRDEKRRAEELAGLAQLSQVFRDLREPGKDNLRSLCSQMLEGIIPLFNFEVLGFLIFNQPRRLLEGMEPFHGLPSQLVSLYHTLVPAESDAERLVLSQETIICSNPGDDKRFIMLGLDQFAKTASFRDSILVPLSMGGRFLGYLQGANYIVDGGLSGKDASFIIGKDELRLLTIVANQATAIIDNANLLERSRQRTQRAETLQRIAGLASSSLSPHDLLKHSVRDLAEHLGADFALVFQLDKAKTNEFTTRLVFQPFSFYSNQNSDAASGDYLSADYKVEELRVDDPQYDFTLIASRKSIILGDLSTTSALIPFYQQFLMAWGIRSVAAAPLIARNEGIGELWFGSLKPNFFIQNDLQLLETASAQLAGVVDQAYLIAQTDETLRWRVEQMTLLAQISRELSLSLDLNHLLNLVYEQAVLMAHASAGSLLLFDLNMPAGRNPKVQFMIGSAQEAFDVLNKELGESDLSQLALKVLQTGEPLNTNAVDLFLEALPHPEIKSLLIVPFYYQKKPVGLITLFANEFSHFDSSTVQIIESVAAQTSVALGNALQYETQRKRGELLNRETETLQKLLQVSQGLEQKQTLGEMLQVIADAIRDATSFEVIIISVYDEVDANLKRICSTGLPLPVWEVIQSRVHPWQQVERLLKKEFRLGMMGSPVAAYFIPAGIQPSPLEKSVSSDSADLLSGKGGESDNEVRDYSGSGVWNPEDLFLAPILNSTGKPLGMISVDLPLDGRRPDTPVLEALELYALLAGVTIENYQHKNILQLRLNDLEGRQEGLKYATKAAQQNQTLMLEKDNLQLYQIDVLKTELAFARTGSNIAEQISNQNDISSALDMIAAELYNSFKAQQIIIVEQTRTDAGGDGKSFGELRLAAFKGEMPVPFATSIDALLAQHNPLRHVLPVGAKQADINQEENTIIVPDLLLESEWQNSPLLNAVNSKSFICFPLFVGWQTPLSTNIGVLVLSQNLIPLSVAVYAEIVHQLAEQISINLHSLLQLSETRHRLGEMGMLLEFNHNLEMNDTGSILSKLVETILKVVPLAQAGWVGLTDGSTGELLPLQGNGYDDFKSLLAVRYEPDSQIRTENLAVLPLPLRVLRSGFAERIGEVQFARDYHLSSQDLLVYKKGTGGKLPVSSLCVPLLRGTGKNPLGVLVLDNFNIPNAFNGDDETLVLSLCQFATTLLENARLYEEKLLHAAELDFRTQRLGKLNHFSSELATLLEIQRVFELIAGFLDSSLDVSYVAGVMIAPNGNIFLESEMPMMQHLNALPLPLVETPLYDSMRRGMEKLNLGSLFSTSEQSLLPMNDFEACQVESHLLVPIAYHGRDADRGGLFGWIWLEANTGYRFSESEIDLASTIGNQAAIVIQNIRLFDETFQLKEGLEQRVRERIAQLDRHHQNDEALLDIITRLSISLDASRVINEALELLNRSVGADQSMLLLIDSGSPIYQVGESLTAVLPGTENLWITPEQEISRYVMHHKKPLRLDDITTDTSWFKADPDFINEINYRSVQAVPLLLDDEAQGTLFLFSKAPSAFSDEQLNLIQVSAHQFSVALNNSALYKLARSQSDSLSIMLRNQQTILEAIIDGVLVTDTENRIVLFNGSSERILGMQALEVIGGDLEQFKGLLGQGIDEWVQMIWDWVKDPTPERISQLTYSKRITLFNGIIVSLNLAPVFWGMEFLGTVSILRDITHEVKLDRLKSEFVANVSHELRTPITSIKGYVQILLMGAAGALSDQQTQFLHVVRNNTERLTILVNDLLDISKIEAGEIAIALEPISLLDLSQDVVAEVQRRSADEKKDMLFKIEAEPELPKVKADRVRLRQVLYNLVSNGYNYTPAGGNIIVNIHSAGAEVQVDVKDNGIGIRPDDQPRLFERFYRGEDPLVLATAGTGLGLAISKILVEMYQGRIWFSSTGEPGEGSVFSFTLPIFQEE